MIRLQVFGQITLTFRYGREDEEVMGLKFCNEAVMCVAQLYPPLENVLLRPLTPLQVHYSVEAHICHLKQAKKTYKIFQFYSIRVLIR